VPSLAQRSGGGISWAECRSAIATSRVSRGSARGEVPYA